MYGFALKLLTLMPLLFTKLSLSAAAATWSAFIAPMLSLGMALLLLVLLLIETNFKVWILYRSLDVLWLSLF